MCITHIVWVFLWQSNPATSFLCTHLQSSPPLHHSATSLILISPNLHSIPIVGLDQSKDTLTWCYSVHFGPSPHAFSKRLHTINRILHLICSFSVFLAINVELFSHTQPYACGPKSTKNIWHGCLTPILSPSQAFIEQERKWFFPIIVTVMKRGYFINLFKIVTWNWVMVFQLTFVNLKSKVNNSFFYLRKQKNE